jgi:hypothetical protein
MQDEESSSQKSKTAICDILNSGKTIQAFVLRSTRFIVEIYRITDSLQLKKKI